MNTITTPQSLLAGRLKLSAITNLFGVALAGLVLAGSHSPAGAAMIVDRGLPMTNLNDAAASNRSNVSWAEPDLLYFDGDDFTMPASERIDTIRVWFVGYGANNDAILTDDAFLGDFYQNLSLYVGPVGSPLNRVSLSNFVAGSDGTDNPNVVATRVQYSGAATELDYQSGSYWTVVQLDFNNLNLVFAAGTQVQFGIHTDQAVVGGDYAFSHASNAALSGSPQEQADGLFRSFMLDADPATATFSAIIDSYPSLWDKSSDVNVQVFASTAEDQINLLIGAVTDLAPPRGNALIRRLRRALRSLGNERTEQGCAALDRFVKHVQRLVDQNKLAAADGSELTDAVNQVKASIVCPA